MHQARTAHIAFPKLVPRYITAIAHFHLSHYNIQWSVLIIKSYSRPNLCETTTVADSSYKDTAGVVAFLGRLELLLEGLRLP